MRKAPLQPGAKLTTAAVFPARHAATPTAPGRSDAAYPTALIRPSALLLVSERYRFVLAPVPASVHG